MLGKCPHFTLTDSFVIIQKINFLVAGSEFKKKNDEWKTFIKVQGIMSSPQCPHDIYIYKHGTALY